MPWLRAELRGQTIFARATDQGELAVKNGRVEIRYRADDGRLYRAAPRNLTVLSPQKLLPDDACGPAEPAPPANPSKSAKSSKSSKARRAAGGDKSGSAVQEVVVEPGATVVYTDGACSSNPGPAGLGVVVLCGEEQIEQSEYLGQGTNNIAELTAVLRALGHLQQDQAAVIHTDSKYTIGVVQQGWKAKKNRELVAALRAEIARRPKVKLVYVPGHAGVPLNERADELARQAIATGRTTVVTVPRQD
jgi:ribonuclease HI